MSFILIVFFYLARVMNFKAKRLIVMDIAVFLCYHCNTSDDVNNSRSFTIERSRILSRPYLHEFLNFCFKYFDVAVWSCMLARSLVTILETLFNDEQRRSLKFSLDKKECIALDLMETKTFIFECQIEFQTM